MYNGKHLLRNLLDIEVPVSASVTDRRSSMEIAVLSDITIASENAEFQDVPIFSTVWIRATECTLCGRSCREVNREPLLELRRMCSRPRAADRN
jgi:hypothetical protein